MVKISVVSTAPEEEAAEEAAPVATANSAKAETKPAERDADSTEGSSGSEHDPWVEYIKSSSKNLQQQRGMDAEEVNRPLPLEP